MQNFLTPDVIDPEFIKGPQSPNLPSVFEPVCNFSPGNMEIRNEGICQPQNLSRFREVFGNIYQPPPVIVPVVIFDERPGIEYLLQNKLPDQSNQDITRIVLDIKRQAELLREDILKRLIPIGDNSGLSFSDSRFYYQLESGFLYQLYVPKNSWAASDNSAQGNGIFSFSKYITGLTDMNIFIQIVNFLEIGTSGVAVPQPYGGEDDIFLDNSYFYVDLACHSYSPITFLGCPHTIYEFPNDYGQIGFYLHEWVLNGEIIQLFYSLHYNQKTRQISWGYLAPPTEYLLFNKYFITRYKDCDIHIHDDIANVKSGIYDGVIDTWSGDLSIAESLPWDCLKGTNAKIRYFFDETKDESVAIGVMLRDKLGEIGIHLEWVALNNYQAI